MKPVSLISEDAERRILASLHDLQSLGAVLAEFADGGDLRRSLDEIVRSGLGERFEKAAEVGRDAVVLLRRPDVVVSMLIVRTHDGLLHSTGADGVVVVRGPAPVTLDRYSIPEPFEPSVFVPDAELSLISSVIVGDVVIERAAAPVVYDYHAPCPFALIRATLPPPNDQIWFFDRATLRSRFAALGHSELSGYVMLVRLMSVLGERQALPMLEALTRHDCHVVRWSAIQAIGKLDGDRGVTCLRDALIDRHPHIRQGARRALDQLDHPTW